MRLLEYHEGGAGFEGYETPNAGTAQNTRVVWETDDLDADVGRLRNAGVVFEDFEIPDMRTENGVVSSDEMPSAWFRDSEGDILCIIPMVR